MASPDGVLQEPFSCRRVQECDLEGIVQLIKIENLFIVDRTKMDILHLENITSSYVIVDTSKEDKVIGIGSLCKTRSDEAMLGNVIIRKEFRRQGLATYFLRKIISLHDDVNVTWSSTTDELYLKMGFQTCEQHGFSVEMAVHREKLNTYVKENPLEKTVQIVFFTEDRREDLVRYDAEARGYESRQFLYMVTRASEKTAIAVRGSEQRIVGYVAICSEAAGALLFKGFYADDNGIAAALLRTALDAFPSLDRVRYYTLYSCQFFLQFGEPMMALKRNRFSSKPNPAKIPEDKLYCLSEIDLSY